MSYLNVFVASWQQLFFQLMGLIPKILAALIIWIVGKYFISWGINLLKRVDTKGVKPARKLLDSFTFILMPLGKVFLFLIILDYLGIGSSVISALVSGITFAIAIAVGLAFGKALEDDAKAIVQSIKKELEK